MKKYSLFLIIVFIIILTMASCRKVSHNGDLDGQWQLQTVSLADGSSMSVRGIYYDFMLHTAQMRGGGPVCTGNMVYDKKKSIFIEFPVNKASQFNRYGLCAADFTEADKGVTILFTVRRITSKEMTLVTSSGRILDFKKF